jgi:hypothetical protein
MKKSISVTLCHLWRSTAGFASGRAAPKFSEVVPIAHIKQEQSWSAI